MQRVIFVLENARVKIYPNGVKKVTIFNYPRFIEKKRVEDLRPIRSSFTKDNDSDFVRSDSIRRAIDKVFDIAYLNADDWIWFITFTLDKEKINRHDSAEVSKYMRNWLSNQVKRKGLKYLIVPELHKDKAIHLHGFLNDCDFNFVDSGHFDKENRRIYNVKDWRLGFSTAVLLDDSKINICKYICKYIVKGSDKILGNFYLAGGKVKREVPFKYIQVDYNDFDVPEFEIPNTTYKVKYVVLGAMEDNG